MVRALEAATQLAGLVTGEARAQAQVAYLQGLITLRDWQTGVASSDPSSAAANPEQASGLPGAKLDLEKAVRLDETWAAAWYHLGGVLLLSRENGAAEAAFVKCAQLEPRWARAHEGLGAAYYAGMKYKEAIAAYQKALEIEPRSSRAYAGLGLARAAKGDVAAGVKDVQKAMELDPTSALPHLNLGIIGSLSKKDKDHKRAEEELKRAIQMNPQNIEFQNRMAEQLLADLQSRKKKKK
jgi:tetratricopeptide (TPR) repeat protein